MPPPTLRGRSKNRPFGFSPQEKHRSFGPQRGTKSTKNGMISVAEAIQIVRQQTATLTTERVDLPHALGRVLAEDVVADSDLPPFDRAQMDGYAVRSSDTLTLPARLRVVGESAAGRG